MDNEIEISEGAGVRFMKYKNHFLNMTNKKYIFTQFDVMSVIITYDSQHLIAVLEASEKLYYVRIYGLENHVKYREFMIEGQRIKAKEVQQNSSGSFFALPYFDSGLYKILFFNMNGDVDHLLANSVTGIDDSTLAIAGISDPLI